ncbi:MAG: arylsulfotransferase family protein [Albidovulum sp.]|uniref:arylsulfotransferase family protein n=1 Tax=Albidovulum sp. TaxID=1872424 RepID=UPI003CB75884
MDYSGFAPVRSADGIQVDGLLVLGDSDRIEPGWRVLVGAFKLNGAVTNSALLMSPDLEIVHVWTLDEVPVGEVEPRPPHKKLPHGFEMFPNGSIIYTFDGSMSLQSKDACGNRLWAAKGPFSHAVTSDSGGDTVWSIQHGPGTGTGTGTGTGQMGVEGIAQAAVEDGAIIREIRIDDIITANPDIDILALRRAMPNELGRNRRNTPGAWMADSLHLNDVDPLPAHLAAVFPGFDTGDLLISARSLNLVFVLDPETLRIKWWQVGLSIRQHDPDWMPSGEIMIFNNRMGRDYSEIIAIDPQTNTKRVVHDGRDTNFCSRIRGKVQMFDNGTLAVTSPQQGRVFEVNPEGEVVLEIVNTKSGDDDFNYVISEQKWLPPDFFSTDLPDCLADIRGQFAEENAL